MRPRLAAGLPILFDRAIEAQQVVRNNLSARPDMSVPLSVARQRRIYAGKRQYDKRDVPMLMQRLYRALRRKDPDRFGNFVGSGGCVRAAASHVVWNELQGDYLEFGVFAGASFSCDVFRDVAQGASRLKPLSSNMK